MELVVVGDETRSNCILKLLDKGVCILHAFDTRGGVQVGEIVYMETGDDSIRIMRTLFFL